MMKTKAAALICFCCLFGAWVGSACAGVPATAVHPRNLFQAWLGKSDTAVQTKVDAAWHQLFYGDNKTQRIYYPVGDDMAYIEDVNNRDVRTEGMSYGMMIAVQTDHKAEFDRIWKWARTYMYHKTGPYHGFFAWHCATDGHHLDETPACDGEEWFVMSLFFAANRWGNGTGIYNYKAEANALLHEMLHKTDEGYPGIVSMFDPQSKQVRFVPKQEFAKVTDPSYQLPAFYELWAKWAAHDRHFWTEAAAASRVFFRKAANKKTGLMPDYATFDGKPFHRYGHENFKYDAWRTLSNVAMDHLWGSGDSWEVHQSNRVLTFFQSQGPDYPNLYTLDGKPLSKGTSPGLYAMAATAGLAANRSIAQPFVQRLWDMPIPDGNGRYYDGMLYMLALLEVSGHFQIHAPAAAP